MNFVHEIVNYINNLPPDTWSTLGSYLGGSALVASLLQVLKHKFNFADAKKVLVFASGALSAVVAIADFLLQANSSNPLPTIGHMTGLLMAGAVIVHRFAVSPGYYKLATYFQKASTYLGNVEAYAASQKAVATPAQPNAPASDLPDESNLAQFQV